MSWRSSTKDFNTRLTSRALFTSGFVDLDPTGNFPTSGSIYDLVQLIIRPPFNTQTMLFYNDFTNWITSLIWFPLNKDRFIGTEYGRDGWKLKISDYETNIPVYRIDYFFEPLRVVSDYDYFVNNITDKEDFVNYEPYTTYKLYLPFYGYVDILYKDVKAKYIDIDLSIDFMTGQGLYIIYVKNSTLEKEGRIIAKCESKIGYSIPIGTDGSFQAVRNMIMGAIKTAGSAISAYITSGASVVKSVITSPTTTSETQSYRGLNPKTNRLRKSGETQTTTTVSEGRTDVIKPSTRKENVSSSLINGSIDSLNKMTISPSIDKPNNSCLNNTDANTIYLIISRCNISTVNNTYKHINGLPLGETKNLNDMRGSGYTEISNIHISGEDFSQATNEELNMLQELLTSGIIL